MIKSISNPRAPQRTISLTVIAWALTLLLLPPLACSGTAAPGGGASEATESPGMQGDLVAMLPADSTTIGFVDFAALRQSPVYEYFKGAESMANPEEFEEFIEETGIDPRTDLHRLAFASSLGIAGGLESVGGAIVSATFDRARITESLGERPTYEYEGFTVHVLDEPDTGAEGEGDGDRPEDDGMDFDDGVLVILDDTSIAVGDDASVRAMIDVANGAPSARANSQLMSLLEDVDTGSETWFVSANDSLFSSMAPGDSSPMPQIPVDKIKSMILSVRTEEGVALRFRGRTAATEDAKLLGDSLNGMLAFGKMMLQSNSPEIFAIVDRAISAGSSGRDVTLRAELTLDDIDKLQAFAREMFEEQMEGQAQPGS